jgi:hypothetical protein
MDLREIIWGGMDFTALAPERDKWRALVNAVMNFLRNYRVSAQLVASRVVLSSTELVS